MKKFSSSQSGIANILLVVIIAFTLVAGFGLWRIYENQQGSKVDQVNNLEQVLNP